MRDPAHDLADKELEEIEKRIEEIYRRANAEVEKKAAQYFKRFEALDKQKRALVESGDMTEEAYKKWKQGKIMTGKHWETLKKQTAESMHKANVIAADYSNGRLPSVYASNYNQVAAGINRQVRGVNFELVNQQTVRNLATKDKTLLPYKTVNGVKDVRWNTKKVNSEILQGILQGDSVDDLSKRLRKVTEMNRASSVRNARTAVTSAENKGRIDMLHDAEDAGVRTKKVWLSVHDKRTRDAHLALSGEEADPDEPFEIWGMKIMYPGDPDAEPEMVYNCRCTMTYHVIGFWNAKQQTSYEEPDDRNDQYNSQKVTEQIKETPAMNEYYYWSEENDRERFESIKEQTGFDDEKAEKVLQAFSGDRQDYRGVEHTPEGWFYRADTRIRELDGEKWEKAANLIDDYIVSAPKYDGAIYRGLSLDTETLSKIQIGGIFEEKGSLSSWTSSIDVAQMFAEGRTEELGLIPVVIETKSHPYSSPVAHLSMFGSDEQEIIVSNMHGNEYSIENISKTNGVVHIMLKFGGL